MKPRPTSPTVAHPVRTLIVDDEPLARTRLPESEAALLPTRKPPAWVFLTSRLSEASSTALRAQATT